MNGAKGIQPYIYILLCTLFSTQFCSILWTQGLGGQRGNTARGPLHQPLPTQHQTHESFQSQGSGQRAITGATNRAKTPQWDRLRRKTQRRQRQLPPPQALSRQESGGTKMVVQKLRQFTPQRREQTRMSQMPPPPNRETPPRTKGISDGGLAKDEQTQAGNPWMAHPHSHPYFQLLESPLRGCRRNPHSSLNQCAPPQIVQNRASSAHSIRLAIKGRHRHPGSFRHRFLRSPCKVKGRGIPTSPQRSTPKCCHYFGKSGAGSFEGDFYKLHAHHSTQNTTRCPHQKLSRRLSSNTPNLQTPIPKSWKNTTPRWRQSKMQYNGTKMQLDPRHLQPHLHRA